MIRPASTLSTAVINDQRTVTATGRLISTIPLGNTVRLELLMAADAEVEIHEGPTDG